MVEQEVKSLFVRATTDDVIGLSTVDIDGVVRHERRAALWRRGGALVTVAAALVAAVFAIPSLLPGGTGTGPAPGDTPTATPLPASWHDRAVLAGVALTEYFPGVVPLPPDENFRWDGRVRADAETPDQSIKAFAAASRYQGPPGPEVSQCAMMPDCRSFPQADGTVVWLGHDEESGSQGYIAILIRADGTEVQVGVVYSGAMATAPVPEAVLLRAVHDYRFSSMPPDAN